MPFETKIIGGNVLNVKQMHENGVEVGIVEGYIATWDIDRGGFFGIRDQFVKGAFLESIQEHKDRNQRQIRLKDHHGMTIGGFPIDKVHEDDRGLFGVGEINMGVQQGREAYFLAKQGVLSDFSIGFSIEESSLDEQEELRTITKATVWEGSIVDEPMNPEANITAVKSAFQDLPLAGKNQSWDKDSAIRRIQTFTQSEIIPSKTYFKGFAWINKDYSDSFAAHKLPLADVIDGKLCAIPKAIFAAAENLLAVSGACEIPDPERASVIQHLERYYAKMGLESPFPGNDKQFFSSEDTKKLTKRQLEDVFLKTGHFSKGAAKFLASNIDLSEKTEQDLGNDVRSGAILDELKSLKSLISDKTS